MTKNSNQGGGPALKSLSHPLVLPDLPEELVFTVFPLARYDAILGKPWLSMNNPTINYSTNEVQVGSGKSWSARTDSRSSSPAAALSSQPDVQLNFISGKQARHALRKGEEGFMVWVTEEKADISVPCWPAERSWARFRDGRRTARGDAFTTSRIPRHTSEWFAYEVTPRAVNKSRDRFRTLCNSTF